MKAMILSHARPVETNPLELAHLSVPKPGPDELLVRVHMCGICHTDLHMVEGELPLPKQPVIPGHQVVGIVAERGKRVSRFQPGDRVGIAWLHATCGSCAFCQSGRENLCPNAQFTGYHVDGGYAEYALVSQEFAYPIPTGFSDREAAPLLCAGIIGYRALRLCQVEPGQRLGLYGFGASAHVAIQVAVHQGCEVYVFTRSKQHQDLARRLGALWTGRGQDDPPRKLHGAILFAPAGELVPQALYALERGGTLCLAGIYLTPIPQLDYTQHLYYEKKIQSVTASTRRDGEELLHIAAQIPIHTETQLFSLEEANQALQLLKEGRINGAGVLQVQEETRPSQMGVPTLW